MSAQEQTIQPQLRIIRASERIFVLHPILLMVGHPGLGKSSLSMTAQNPITLNYDGKSGLARTVNRKDAIDIATPDEHRAFAEERSIIAPYDTVIVDTVGRCLDLLTVDIIEQNPKYGRDGGLTQQGYGVLKTRFRTWINQLRAQEKKIILIAHTKEEKEGDVTFYRPDITGGSKDEVLKIADFVGCLHMDGKNRILDFNPTDKWFGKNPANWKRFVIPAPEKCTQFMAKLMEEGREALGKISEVSASVAQKVGDWKLAIDGYTTAAEFNRAIPEIKGLQTLLQAQVVKLLMTRAKEKEMLWDEPNKLFVDPKPAASEVPGGLW